MFLVLRDDSKDTQKTSPKDSLNQSISNSDGWCVRRELKYSTQAYDSHLLGFLCSWGIIAILNPHHEGGSTGLSTLSGREHTLIPSVYLAYGPEHLRESQSQTSINEPTKLSGQAVDTARGTTHHKPRSNYELFNRSNVNIRYWSWNYCGCWHQTCLPIDLR